MEQLVFATNNANKLKEARELVGRRFTLLSLSEIEFYDELPETANTLEHNAHEKAAYVQARWGGNVFAEDSGLLVDALGGEPGVYSARFAGIGASDSENLALLLNKLGDLPDREAHFETVISLWFGDQWYQFKGECAGRIGLKPSGAGGFGYDPVFYPQLNGQYADRSFAEMSREEKNIISHRGKAVRLLMEFLGNV